MACIDLLWYFCSEWVLGNREDLVKDIIQELEPENGEVSFYIEP